MDYDVFNGDADGICALHQLRLANPKETIYVTGVKRNIALLTDVQAQGGDRITVLDVSFKANRRDVLRLLDAGAFILYFDHHTAGDIPQHDRLEVHIDTDADVCTSLLVNNYLGGRYLPWAVVAAFGDNLHEAARKAAAPLGLDTSELARLERLGTLLNYNGYGLTLNDLRFHPAELYRALKDFEDPFCFIETSEVYRILEEGFIEDMNKARNTPVLSKTSRTRVILLPNEAWARRVSGVFANQLARERPECAHALVMKLPNGTFRISVRAPLTHKEGADEICMRFPTGGGRKAAAGINALPEAMFEDFIRAFERYYEA